MKHPKSILVAALLLAVAAPRPTLGQSADALLRRVGAEADARVQGVNSYTVEMSGLASTVTLYTVRRAPSSPLFQVQFGASGSLGASATDFAWGDIFQLMLQQTLERARRDRRLFQVGTAEISGVPVHVVTHSFPQRSRSPGGDAPQRLTAYYDTTTLLARKIEWVVKRADGAEIQVAVEYDDYRPVQGMQIAFRRRRVTRGLRATLGAAEIARMQSSVDALRADLPRQPQAVQTQSTKMIEALEGMLTRDELVSEMTVTSVVVNQGPPAGVQLTTLGP